MKLWDSLWSIKKFIKSHYGKVWAWVSLLLLQACSDTKTMPDYHVVEKWNTITQIIEEKGLWKTSEEIRLQIADVIKINNLDENWTIHPWDTLRLPTIPSSKEEIPIQEIANPKTLSYSHITSQSFSLSDEYLVQQLYKDKNTRKRIEEELKKWYTVLIPNEIENKNSNIIPLQNIIKSNEILSNILKWKHFTLDPWHGGMDIWAIGITQYGKVENKQKIVVYESAVMMDLTYRIAKGLKTHWAEVDLTHFYSTRDISDNKDLPPAYRFSQKWEEAYQDIRSTTHKNNPNQKGEVIAAGSKMLKKRAAIANQNKSSLFVSFHADILWNSTNINTDKKILSLKVWEWKTQSQAIAKNLLDKWFWYYYEWKKSWAVSHDVASQSLCVLNNLNDIPGILVEVWNMANTDQAYYLRDPNNRQKLADWFIEALLKYYVK